MQKKSKMPKMVKSSASFSGCQKYRYSLVRVWDKSLPVVVFICLNPSTADARKNDHTIRRCVYYAMRWGYGGIIMLNLFAYKATYPTDMKAAEDPVGPNHDLVFSNFLRKANLIVCAWGNDGSYRGRDKEVLALIQKYGLGMQPHCLKVTKSGQPSHPARLRSDLKPILYGGVV